MSNDCCNCDFDYERMKEAVESESREMPSGLNREEMRQWLIDFANEPDDSVVKTEEEIWCDYRETMYNAWADKQKSK